MIHSKRLKIRGICMEDCGQIAELHRANIQDGFLSLLGASFLKLIYQTMVNSNVAFCIVAEYEERVVGFVSGTTSLNRFYKDFIRRKFFKATALLLPKIINFKTIKKIFNTLFYPSKVQGLPDEELLSIVVDIKVRNQGIAKMLLKELVSTFKERGIKKFKILAAVRFESVNRFYENKGATFYSEITAYEGEKWRAYIWEI